MTLRRGSFARFLPGVLLALVGALAAPGPSEALSPYPTFELNAVCADGSRYGNGFLARGWSDATDRDQIFLVTALHVVHGCDTLMLTQVDCTLSPDRGREPLWTMEPGATVLAWPTYDLAAIPIPGDRADRLLEGRAPITVDLSAKLPQEEESVNVYGTSRFTGCPGAPGRIMHYSTAGLHARHLAKRLGRPGLQSRDVQGSLLDDTELVFYHAPAFNGASGSPVLVTSGGIVRAIGVHHAGYEEVAISWGIVFRPTLARHEPTRVTMDRGRWPPFATSRFAESDIQALPTELLTTAKRFSDEQVEVYKEVSGVFSTYLDRATELLVSLRRDVPRGVRSASAVEQLDRTIASYNEARNHVVQLGRHDVLIDVHNYWGEEASEQAESVLEKALDVHAAIFPNLNEPIVIMNDLNERLVDESGRSAAMIRMQEILDQHTPEVEVRLAEAREAVEEYLGRLRRTNLKL